jgi:hypothetical protein
MYIEGGPHMCGDQGVVMLTVIGGFCCVDFISVVAGVRRQRLAQMSRTE